jgi:hypothetical protein
MQRSLLALMVLLTMLYGCGEASKPVERVEKQHGLDKQAREQETTAAELAPEPPASEPPASEPPNLPEYNIMMDEDCSEGFPQKCINAATGATSEEAFTLLTEHFRDENPGYRAILVTFYENHQMTETTGSGWSFADEEAARTLLSQQYSDYQERDIDKQVREVMDNGGIYITSLQDEAQEMIEMACEDWDAKVVGPPPAFCYPAGLSPAFCHSASSLAFCQ